jgi:anti-sigma B factor antagonist
MSDRPNRLEDRPDRCPVCGVAVTEEADVYGPAGDLPCPHCGHLLWFTSARVDDVTIVRLMDTRAAVIELLDLLDNALDDVAGSRLVLNLGGIQQVSSATLGKLIKLRGRAEALHGKLRLCGLHPDLRQVFRITGLDRLFDLHDNEEDALASFRAEAAAVGDENWGMGDGR